MAEPLGVPQLITMKITKEITEINYKYLNCQKINKDINRVMDTEDKLMVARCGAGGEMKGKIQTSGNQINQSVGCNVEYREDSQ